MSTLASPASNTPRAGLLQPIVAGLLGAFVGFASSFTILLAGYAALAEETDRLPAVLTFVTTASGLSSFGIGAAFWGLVAGGILMALLRWRAR